eukprot:Phypoly_transcript_09546.p2 GENE.Phypoly_transcript_09546~~Phypoly_transcript_09546.p2  ORF type:complete len:213 (-),score=52.47 Phypoly_transcript_09546:695-1333(-)
MSNRTDPLALSVHGTNPQNLIEKILRMRIYANAYWKEKCFGLTAATLVDRAMELDMYGGTYGGNKKPSKFMCLILKMLQIQPEKEIVVEFIKNEEYRYVRVLGAFYLRLVGRPMDIYNYLEPLYNDFRRIRVKTDKGYRITHMDEFIDELLHDDHSCDIALPHLPKRHLMEQTMNLPPRISALEDEDMPEEEEDDKKKKKRKEIEETETEKR